METCEGITKECICEGLCLYHDARRRVIIGSSPIRTIGMRTAHTRQRAVVHKDGRACFIDRIDATNKGVSEPRSKLENIR